MAKQLEEWGSDVLDDWNLVKAIFDLCDVPFKAELDKSTTKPRPYWIGPRKLDLVEHWHIFFDPDGSFRDSSMGRPCTRCTVKLR